MLFHIYLLNRVEKATFHRTCIGTLVPMKAEVVKETVPFSEDLATLLLCALKYLIPFLSLYVLIFQVVIVLGRWYMKFDPICTWIDF